MINMLGITFHATLQVKSVHSVIDSDIPSDEDDDSDLEGENIARNLNMDFDKSIEATSKKCLHRYETFPKAGRMSSKSGDGKQRTPNSQLQENASYSRSLSLPRRLVSALKGSRPKEEGAPPRKLNVSWAPDVYDPPPTPVSHSPKKKTHQQLKSKKHGRGRQKGKNTWAAGSGPKDKKHHQKMGGRSEPCLDSYVDNEMVMSRDYKSSAELLDFNDDDVGDGADSNCGARFLRKAHGNSHFAYAEAT
ncbi:hypothetical protein Nepgr_011981 [Nepenthes gracilis]|uniref:Uncharacterized protein n=1 Tax=Nepenthes gracilis TaxID=150966 RepID=A0AAD3XMW6_NEPGR|nr:hypothetical protein Nepgr_011981 [Nepenthes gracilis]